MGDICTPPSLRLVANTAWSFSFRNSRASSASMAPPSSQSSGYRNDFNVGPRNGDRAVQELWIARHAETIWTVERKHTYETDLDLTPNGVLQAERLGRRLA